MEKQYFYKISHQNMEVMRKFRILIVGKAMEGQEEEMQLWQREILEDGDYMKE